MTLSTVYLGAGSASGYAGVTIATVAAIEAGDAVQLAYVQVASKLGQSCFGASDDAGNTYTTTTETGGAAGPLTGLLTSVAANAMSAGGNISLTFKHMDMHSVVASAVRDVP